MVLRQVELWKKKKNSKNVEMLRNTSGNSKIRKLEDTDLDIPNNKFLTSQNQKRDSFQGNIDNIVKINKKK